MANVFTKVAAALLNLWKAFWSDAPGHFIEACTGVVHTVEAWLYDAKRASYGIAVARMLFACTALGLLLTNFNTRYYTYGSASAWTGSLNEASGSFSDDPIFGIFHSIAGNDVAVTLYFLLLMVLAIALLVGLRARIVLPVFLVLWIGLIESSHFGSDQGDNAMRIGLFLLMFTDHSARWSFDTKRRAKNENYQGSTLIKVVKGAKVLPANLTNLWHNLAIVALACQVFMIYVSGALFKAGGEPWRDGTAVYGPLHTLRFGPWPELSDLITTMGWAVAVGAIGSIILQVVFPGALLFRWTRIPVLFGMVSFHIGIAVLMGLTWFSLAMVAIDAIFIRDVTWLRLANWFKNSARGGQAETPGEPKDQDSQENEVFVSREDITV